MTPPQADGVSNSPFLSNPYAPRGGESTLYEIESLQIVHTLFVEGNSAEGILYGFVELFSTFRFIGLLSDEYNGKDFQETYSYDVVNCKPVDMSVDSKMSRGEILRILKDRNPEIEKIRQVWDLRIDRITNIAVVLFSPFSFIFSFLS